MRTTKVIAEEIEEIQDAVRFLAEQATHEGRELTDDEVGIFTFFTKEVIPQLEAEWDITNAREDELRYVAVARFNSGGIFTEIRPDSLRIL